MIKAVCGLARWSRRRRRAFATGPSGRRGAGRFLRGFRARNQPTSVWSNHLVGPPKTDAGNRTLAIPSGLIDALRLHLDEHAQPGDGGYVFTGHNGGPLAPHVLHDAWSKARTEVGLPHLHFHDLRHLAGTLAASTGAGTKEIMYRLGHNTHQAALRYQHATRERDRSIADAIDRILLPEQ